MRAPSRIFSFGGIILLSLALSACGPATRTADGDCYYRGKGALALGAQLLDGVVAYADAELEAAYQRDQIELQKLGEQLDAINPYSLRGDDIATYNNAVERYNFLQARVDEHQARKQRRLKDGPRESFSKKVDESGDCE